MTGRGDPNGPTHPWRLVDTHCHLDRMTNAGEVARAEGRAGGQTRRAGMTGRGDPNGPTHPWRLVDTHCHLDRMTNAGEVAARALELDVAVLCTTVGPDDAQGAQAAFAGHPNVRVAVGLHPWWVADGTEGERQGARAAEMAASWDLVGEVGLDLSPAHADTRNAQLSAFDRIVSACAGHPREGRVLSIHADGRAR